VQRAGPRDFSRLSGHSGLAVLAQGAVRDEEEWVFDRSKEPGQAPGGTRPSHPLPLYTSFLIIDKSGMVKDIYTFSVRGLWPNTASNILQIMRDSLKDHPYND
jgi:hypothetical protein